MGYTSVQIVARKREATRYNTGELVRGRENMAAPIHRDTTCEKVVNTFRVNSSILGSAFIVSSPSPLLSLLASAFTSDLLISLPPPRPLILLDHTLILLRLLPLHPISHLPRPAFHLSRIRHIFFFFAAAFPSSQSGSALSSNFPSLHSVQQSIFFRTHPSPSQLKLFLCPLQLSIFL